MTSLRQLVIRGRQTLAAAGIADQGDQLPKAATGLPKTPRQELPRIGMKTRNINQIFVVEITDRCVRKGMGRLGLGCDWGAHERRRASLPS